MKKIELLFKNLLLELLLIFNRTKGSESPLSPDKNSKLLFIRLNRIGDALVTTPLLHFVKEKIKCKIYVLADAKNFFVYSNNPDIDEIIIFKKGIKGFKEFFRLIRSENINIIIDLHDDVSTTVSFLVALSNSENKLGLEKENKKIYTRTIPKLDPVKVHVVTRILEISRLLNLNPDDAELCIRYFPEKEAFQKTEKFINNMLPGKPITGINISAGSDARFWGVEKYRQLINSLSSSDMEILLIAAPKDKDKVELIGYNKYFISDSFDEFAAVISKLKILLSPDTAAIHLASAYKVPVFGIYVHDTDDMIWSPVNVDFDYIETKEHSLANMQLDEVLNKFIPFLEKHIK